MSIAPRARTLATLLSASAIAACGGGMPDPDTLTATEAAAGVCDGRWTSTALVNLSLAKARTQAELNAFITLDEAGARRAARESDARRAAGLPCRPLEGVPIVVKDNIHAAGLPSTAGTPALAGFVPADDAPVVRALRGAGAIVLGKTHMHELAFGISGYNTAFIAPGRAPGVRNAYDVSKMAGGSSAGNGAALGARIATAALGTDTGGSVRIPCALNGCAALRPTMGRYAQDGIAPISHTRDTAGPMAQSAADLELLDRVITGAAPVTAADLRGVRLGIAADFTANLDADTRAAFDATIARLRGAGVTIVDVTMPDLAALNGAVGFPVALYEAYDDIVAYLARHRPALTIEQLALQIASPDVKGTYDALVIPRKLPAPDGTLVDAAPVYRDAMQTHRPALQRLYAETFAANAIDALVFPTVPRVALDANADASSLANFLLFIQNTDPGSNAGIPGLQLPIALGAASRLPIGIELDGPAGSDRRLLAIGSAIEALLGRLPAKL